MTQLLSNICDYINEKIAVNELSDKNYISTENMLPNKSGIVKASTLPNMQLTPAYQENDVLISNIRPYFKKIWQAEYCGGCSNDVLVLRAKQFVNPKFLYYVLSEDKFFDYATATSKGTKMPRGDKSAIMKYGVPEFSEIEQEKIANILFPIDKKIAINSATNNNLEQQAMALFTYNFIDNSNENRISCKAEEYFDISIGKTPPRKEPEWFSVIDGVKWVSISDMGNCGMYISNSSEYLTPSAIDKYNVKIVPDNTVILSFKLTVGRVAITVGEMTTNEAIAHFKTDNKKINEYLYCYLKKFNYQTMGSTSSIATAVNSKIIKAMLFVIPTDDEINKFHTIVKPIFNQIKLNQIENSNLIQLRDTLLPKLMSGEIDVSKVEIDDILTNQSADKLLFSEDKS